MHRGSDDHKRGSGSGGSYGGGSGNGYGGPSEKRQKTGGGGGGGGSSALDFIKQEYDEQQHAANAGDQYGQVGHFTVIN